MEFRGLNRQYERLKGEINAAVAEVMTSACFISGPQVYELEEKLADYIGVRYCISCGNGTDAISVMLKANRIGELGGRKDVVFVPDFTFFSTGECPATNGATTIFVDVMRDTYTMDANALEKAIKKVICDGKKLDNGIVPKAVIAVDLFGQPADYDVLNDVCEKYGLLLLEDGAQAFGGLYRGRRACSLGSTSTTSFFPAKPLGCYGDGGAIFTDDDDIASLCRSIAVHGKDMSNPSDLASKYNNVRLGMNSRLDTLQAAILLEKFKAFVGYELESVNRVASWYDERLSEVPELVIPRVPVDCYSSWAQYTVQLPDGVDRATVRARMKEAGIPTMVYYTKPMHKQVAFSGTMSADADCPVTEYLCDHVLCLPIHPYMTEDEVETVSNCLVEAILNLNYG